MRRAEIKADDGGNGRQFRQVYGANARDDAVYLAENGDSDDSAVCTCCCSICQSPLSSRLPTWSSFVCRTYDILLPAGNLDRWRPQTGVPGFELNEFESYMKKKINNHKIGRRRDCALDGKVCTSAVAIQTSSKGSIWPASR